MCSSSHQPSGTWRTFTGSCAGSASIRPAGIVTLFFAGLWIRIGSGVSDFLDPDPDTYFCKKCWLLTPVFLIWFDSNFEKEIVFESSVLAWIRIRIEQKWWIRIRIKSIRIHNPDFLHACLFCWLLFLRGLPLLSLSSFRLLGAFILLSFLFSWRSC
jgi:hypothetical protein